MAVAGHIILEAGNYARQTHLTALLNAFDYQVHRLEVRSPSADLAIIGYTPRSSRKLLMALEECGDAVLILVNTLRGPPQNLLERYGVAADQVLREPVVDAELIGEVTSRLREKRSGSQTLSSFVSSPEGLAMWRADDIASNSDTEAPRSVTATIIRNKTTILLNSRALIATLSDLIDYDPRGRHHNHPPPELWVGGDEAFLNEIREMVVELKRLNDFLEREPPPKAKRASKAKVAASEKETSQVVKAIGGHADRFAHDFLGVFAKGSGWLVLGALATILVSAGVPLVDLKSLIGAFSKIK